MKLLKVELQYLLSSIDTYIRTNGLGVAAAGALLGRKIQVEMNALQAEEKPEDDTVVLVPTLVEE